MTVRKVDNIKIIKISNYSNFIPAEILYFELGYQVLLLKDLTPEVQTMKQAEQALEQAGQEVMGAELKHYFWPTWNGYLW